MQIIVDRYRVYFPEFNIAKAALIDGHMSYGELAWLSREAKKAHVIIELGSWIGRSARALADNMGENAVLYWVDTFAGSAAEKAGYMILPVTISVQTLGSYWKRSCAPDPDERAQRCASS